MELLGSLFDTSGFPARWDCGTWTPAHGWTHVIADVAIFGAYLAIPVVLGYYTLRRPDVAYRPLFWVFCAFIFACGTTHLIDATLFWQPWYRLSAAMKVNTAVVSWAAVLVLMRLAPRVARMPNFAQMRAIVESTEDAIVGKDLRGRITSWNPGAEALYGYTPDEILGRNISTIVPDERRDELARITVRLNRGERIEPFETVRRRKDGSLVDVSLSITPISDHRGRICGASAIARDISIRKQAEAELVKVTRELERQALHDPLTGLDNRRGMELHITRELGRARREGLSVVAVLIDLDDFKRVNDTLGHGAGDLVLRGTAQRMKGCTRPGDSLGRIGGDEFLVLLPDTRVAERLRLAITDNPVVVSGEPLRLTASLSLVAVPDGSMCLEEMLDLTRHGLSRSKQEGKNRVAVSHEGDTSTGNDADEVQRLLRPESLRVYWQPIFDLRTDRVVGHELLVRGPRGPYHAPYELFRLSLEHNLLTTADLLCFKTCVRRSATLTNGRLHVNLFPSTLLDTPVGRLVDLFEEAGGPRRFCVELSEQQFLGDPSSLCRPVDELKRSDVCVALDDVGFGRSSLEALVVLEPDVVKIDRSFVHGVAAEPGSRRRLERLVRTTRHLSTEMVAEGLELASDRTVLEEVGVERAQGFLLGRPTEVPRPN